MMQAPPCLQGRAATSCRRVPAVAVAVRARRRAARPGEGEGRAVARAANGGGAGRGGGGGGGVGRTEATKTTTTTPVTAVEPALPPPPPPAGATSGSGTWDQLYIIPSSFGDDDGDDEDGGSGEDDQGGGRQPDAAAPAASARVRAWPGAGPIVILPGFGNDTQDYEAPFGQPRRGLAARLRRRGFCVETVRLRRRDWVRVARALASPSYWRGEADVGPGYGWYLARVAAAVRRAERAWEAREAEGAAAAGGDGAGDGRSDGATGSHARARAPGVVLVGHSAGGWLARAFVGDASVRSDAAAELCAREEERALAAIAAATAWGGAAEALATAREVFFSRPLVLPAPAPVLEREGGAAGAAGAASAAASAPALRGGSSRPVPCTREPHPSVAAVVTLGTPHTPPAPGSGARDVTGGALSWVNEHWPGAYFGKNGPGGDGGGAKGQQQQEEAQQQEGHGRGPPRRRPVVYVAVAGRAVVGAPSAPAAPAAAPSSPGAAAPSSPISSAAPAPVVPAPRGSPPSYARSAYAAVAGGDGAGVVGDGVVPLGVAGCLPGADARVVLDGVWHSMSALGSFKDPPAAAAASASHSSPPSSPPSPASSSPSSSSPAPVSAGLRPWYGSGGALDAWLTALRDAQLEDE